MAPLLLSPSLEPRTGIIGASVGAILTLGL